MDKLLAIFVDKPLNGPVRWYLLLSTWIFILSVLYPLHQISTFPLNLLALIGCVEVLHNPFKENYVKSIYILFIHLAPFLWIPYDLSVWPLGFTIGVIVVYLALVVYLQTDPFAIYHKLLNERHTALEDFLSERFGIRLESKA